MDQLPDGPEIEKAPEFVARRSADIIGLPGSGPFPLGYEKSLFPEKNFVKGNIP